MPEQLIHYWSTMSILASHLLLMRGIGLPLANGEVALKKVSG